MKTHSDPEPVAWIEVRPSPIHGQGAFALRSIAGGERVVEYVGEVITKAESVRRCEANNAFVFYLDEQHDLDGNVTWNQARFINHSCSPTCDAVIENGRIWIVARQPIAAEEELSFNYGYDLEAYQAYPCRCGSPDCVGYIVAEEYGLPPQSGRTPAPPEDPAALGG